MDVYEKYLTNDIHDSLKFILDNNTDQEVRDERRKPQFTLKET